MPLSDVYASITIKHINKRSSCRYPVSGPVVYLNTMWQRYSLKFQLDSTVILDSILRCTFDSLPKVYVFSQQTGNYCWRRPLGQTESWAHTLGNNYYGVWHEYWVWHEWTKFWESSVRFRAVQQQTQTGHYTKQSELRSNHLSISHTTLPTATGNATGTRQKNVGYFTSMYQ